MLNAGKQPCKNVGYFTEREKKRTDPEMKHTEFSYRFRNIYLIVFTVSLKHKDTQIQYLPDITSAVATLAHISKSKLTSLFSFGK